jgi:isopentenyl phosphate kinase
MIILSLEYMVGKVTDYGRNDAVAVVFLKLGGSLLTDKREVETPRLEIIRRLAVEIAQSLRADPTLRLVAAHGSGSFGHVYGQRHGTREGVQTPAEWFGFAETADAAARLNRIVMAELLRAGVPAWSIQPSATLRCHDGRIVAGPEETISLALAKGLAPVIFGDVALDRVRGGTIASTEEIFDWLAAHLLPERIVLAGEVDGIYTADPLRDPSAARIPQLTPATLAEIQRGLGGSHGVDVTGGMAAKAAQVLALVRRYPQLEVILCSGLEAGNVQAALTEPARASGTRVTG